MKKYLIEILIIVIISASYGFAAYQRNFVWKDDFSLWKDVADKSPNKARPRNNLGVSYFDAQRFDQAMGEFEKAVRLQPDYADAYYNKGNIYLKKTLYDKAVALYQKAISLNANDSEFYYNIGLAYKNMGRYQAALMEFEKSIEIEPQDHEAYLNMGVVYLKHLKDRKSALPYLRKSLEISPDQAQSAAIRRVLRQPRDSS